MQTRRRFLALSGAGTVLVLLLLAASAMAQPSGYAFTRIATLGGNPFLSYFEPAAVNSRGDVLFAPDLATGGEGVYLWRRGLMTAISDGLMVL